MAEQQISVAFVLLLGIEEDRAELDREKVADATFELDPEEELKRDRYETRARARMEGWLR